MDNKISNHSSNTEEEMYIATGTRHVFLWM